MPTEVQKKRGKKRRRTASMTGATSEPSPIRMKRVDERDELQGLNKRLEQYILYIRERDTTSEGGRREIDRLREKHADELDKLQGRFQKQVDSARGERNDLKSRLSKLQAANEELKHDLKRALQELKNAQAENERLRARCEKLAGQTSGLSAEAAKAKQEALEAQGRVAFLEAKVAQMKADLEKALARAGEAERSAAEAVAMAQNIQDDAELVKKQDDAKIAKLQEQVAALDKTREEVEDELRPIFGRQLQQHVREAKAKADEQKEAGIQELKEAYDEKVSGYLQSMEAALAEAKELRDRNKALQNELRNAKKDGNDAGSRVAGLESRIAALENDLEHEQKARADEVGAVQTALDSLRKEKLKKDKEYDHLMDVNVHLGMEIKAYHLLLEEEERRLKTLSPASLAAAQAAARGSDGSKPSLAMRTKGPIMPTMEEADEEEEPPSQETQEGEEEGEKPMQDGEGEAEEEEGDEEEPERPSPIRTRSSRRTATKARRPRTRRR